MIGVAGSVAVGKSTVARLLRELTKRWPDTPRVELVTTDGFLYPNAELERRGIMDRKGFPESYDRRALLRFVSQVKSGAAEVRAPYYSHLVYDIVPDAEIVVRQPDILIVEGLNVLAPPVHGRLALSDLFDFTIYVDAKTKDIEPGTSTGSSPCRKRPSRVRTRSSTGSPRSRARTRCGRRPRCGGRSTSRTSSRTSCRRAPGRRSC